MKKLLEGKSILLTSYSYALFGGAELNAVELADQLVKFGAKPHFFSYDIDGPLASYINKRFNTRIMTEELNYLAEDESARELKNTQLDIRDYDYIWVGANVIPISIIKQINNVKEIPKFIFIHQSPLVAFPMDAPLMREFEYGVASKILSISDRTTRDCIYRILGKDIPLSKWYNPAPSEFRILSERSGQLKKIAVISSSHPTDEIMDIKQKIQGHGIQIDYIGKFNNNAKLVDSKLYDEYDLIIGIGKNVKYSLVSGVPVYIYGRFGGGGYLDEDNYQINEKMNFSGRGFGKKKSDQIVKEIVDGYDKALSYHNKHREDFISEFSLDIVARNLFEELEKAEPKKIKLSQEHINWLVSMQINLMQRIQTASSVRSMDQTIHKLEADLGRVNKELGDIHKSKSWVLTKPFRFVMGKLKNITKLFR